MSLAPTRYLKGSKYVGAGALIFDPEGRILMIRHRVRNAWEYPAGGANGRESPVATCRREVAEEVGLDLPHYRLISIDFWHGMTPNGNLLFTFAHEVTEAEASRVTPEPLEISDWRWVSRAEALDIIWPRLKPRMEQLLAAYDAGHSAYLESGSPVD
jgi:8-oxo-dGTP diphosphatase